MELPEIVEFARTFAVMVRVHGPDPKGLKMRDHAFHRYHNGTTTLSASGMLLPSNCCDVLNPLKGEKGSNLTPGSAMVVTVASIIEPFLSAKYKNSSVQVPPDLIPEAYIDVMIEEKLETDGKPEAMADGAPKWFHARILTLVDVPASALAIQSLVGASSGSLEHHWEVGWSLASHDNGLQTQVKHEFTSTTDSSRLLSGQKLKDPFLMAKATTRIVILQVPTLVNVDLPKIMISPSYKRGDALLAVGSPFGILSPMHFFNSASLGSVSNFYPLASSNVSLLMADIRCLPGMEGAPVFDEQAYLIGLLTKPLRQMGGAEIQLVIPWQSIEAACNGVHHLMLTSGNGFQSVEHNPNNARTMSIIYPGLSNFLKKQPIYSHSVPSLVDQARTSVCLVTLDNGVWASGVLLNDQGLILTNAHLLEPWRYRGTRVDSGTEGAEEAHLTNMPDDTAIQKCGVTEYQQMGILQQDKLRVTEVSPKILYEGHQSSPNYKGHGRISVRLDSTNSWVWCDAKVIYVSRGPLDISLLQLESVPHRLSPISVDLASPAPGSKAFVIGHGLFGPRCDLFPSISSGVIAKVVNPRKPLLYPSSSLPVGEIPAMLETTAAVHPGGSGGAVVNSSGHMIGLVTSNAKHGGGTVIPHMNFSIPCAALMPIFEFARDTQNLLVLQELDKPNKNLSSIWAMMPLTPEPGPSLPGVHNILKDAGRDGKGSQFAKFIAERQEIFKKSVHPNATENLSRDIIPSKL